MSKIRPGITRLRFFHYFALMKANALVVFLLFALGIVVRSQPDTVKAGAYIISIHDINFHDKEYTMRYWLWFLHKNPGFDFTTQLDIVNAKSIELPDAIIDSVNKKTWVMMKMKCVMKQNWQVEDFPFDMQHLKMKIENSIYDRNSLVFKPDVKGSMFGDEETIDGWTIKNFKISSEENEYLTGFGDPRAGRDRQQFSELIIEMDIEREAWGLFLKIFIGMYIAFLISVLSFSLRPSEMEPRFGLPVGGLFAAVGNKYIIDSLLPESSSFTLVDSLHSITFIAIFITLMISAISLRLHDSGKDKQSNRLNKIGAGVVIIGYVLINLILILGALR